MNEKVLEPKKYVLDQEIWIAGVTTSGDSTKKARKGIFKYYLNNECCVIKFTDVKFKKGGVDDCGVTCLLLNVSPR